ncbi:hypothetical protein LTR85_003114 [Meristemomyces frigidus]|nr:hypothetical protein LTR85_003114 [Meristemomyces frigidus]
MSNSNITLHTAQIANGVKISKCSSRAGLPHDWRKYDFVANEQKSEWFTKINPMIVSLAMNNGLDEGSMISQANWFRVLAPEKFGNAIARYTKETKRLYSVLNMHLEKSGKPYLCTIADIANWSWVTIAPLAGVSSLDEFPAFKAWDERMKQRPAVDKGRHVPEKHHREMLADADLNG